MGHPWISNHSYVVIASYEVLCDCSFRLAVKAVTEHMVASHPVVLVVLGKISFVCHVSEMFLLKFYISAGAIYYCYIFLLFLS